MRTFQPVLIAARESYSPGSRKLALTSTCPLSPVVEVIGINLKPTIDYLEQVVPTTRTCTQPKSTGQPLRIRAERRTRLESLEKSNAQLQRMLTCAKREARPSKMMERMKRINTVVSVETT